MAAKYDEETFIDDLVETIQSGMTAKVAEINTEKADSLTMIVPDPSSYVTDLSSGEINFDPMVYYGLAGIQPTSLGPVSSRTVGVFFDLVFINDHSDPDGGILVSGTLWG